MLEENGTRGMTLRELVLEQREILFELRDETIKHYELEIHPRNLAWKRDVDTSIADLKAWKFRLLGAVGVLLILIPIAISILR